MTHPQEKQDAAHWAASFFAQLGPGCANIEPKFESARQNTNLGSNPPPPSPRLP
ncbi:hypothetical protein B224_4961 [Aeromonas media WS]|nr:hypothetical protein B224_4961 [Aeromonas media WS]